VFPKGFCVGNSKKNIFGNIFLGKLFQGDGFSEKNWFLEGRYHQKLKKKNSLKARFISYKYSKDLKVANCTVFVIRELPLMTSRDFSGF
jgi:hypothetical protein